jgi:stage II sporulation protein D
VSRLGWIALALAVGMSIAVARWSDHVSPPASPATDKPAVLLAQIPPVRVRLAHLGPGPVVLRVDGPYRVTLPSDWRVLAQGSQLSDAEATASDRVIRVGPRTFEARCIELQAVQRGTLWINNVRYDGDVRLLDRGDGQLLIVNVMPVEDYVAGVVAAEASAVSSSALPQAAGEALAITARSLVLYRMKTFGTADEWDLEDTVFPWAYAGEDVSGQTARAAAAQTAGIVVTYRGRLVCTFSTASCGGHTFDGRSIFREAAPPLIGVPCEGCREMPAWERRVACATLKDRVEAYLTNLGRPIGSVQRLEIARDSEGSVPTVAVVGSQSTWTADANVLRSQVLTEESLPGNRFRIESDGTGFRVVGYGVGHGVGLCRRGARHMASGGRDAVEILQHYFPQAELVTVR